MEVLLGVLLLTASLKPADAAEKWPAPVASAVAQAGGNQAEIVAALQNVPRAQRESMEFLVANMPEADLHTLSAKFLTQAVASAYAAWNQAPWKARISKELFLNAILPYASLSETRDESFPAMREKALPLVAGCKTPGEAALRLNEKLFPLVHVRYSTERQRPDQSPLESMASGKASCSGLAILLVDACRSVGIPARVAGTPLWANLRGNHTWAEVWDAGGWHFLGAAEPDAQGLDHAWFTHDASEARKDDPMHAIYAASFLKTGLTFPLVWADDNHSVAAVNVTERYVPEVHAAITPGLTRLLVKVLDESGKRIAVPITVRSALDSQILGEAISRGEASDLNDIAAFSLPQSQSYTLTTGRGAQTVLVGTDPQQVVVIRRIAPLKRLPPASFKALTRALAEYFAAPPDKQAHWEFPKSLDTLLRKKETAVRAAAWDAYKAAPIHADAKADFAARQVRYGQYLSAYTLRAVGTRPANGWGLVIAMHGGGGAPKEVNDQQWVEMQHHYFDHPENGGYLYLALRAPNDTWNGFYDDYVYPLIANLIKQNTLFGDVDPSKVYLIGYSHGGYGAFAIGPKEPDLFAAIHASAAAPTDGETTAKTLRNTNFSVWVGEHDLMYDRLSRDQKFAAEVKALRGDRTDIYPVTTEIKIGHGHSDLPDRDLLAGMTNIVRNPVPRELTWQMTDTVITDFFWLQTSTPGKGREIDATCLGNKITVTATPDIKSAALLLDSRLVDLSVPIDLIINGKHSEMHLTPSLRTLCETLKQRGDPERAFTVRVEMGL